MATPLENEDVQKINEEALSNFLENAAQVLQVILDKDKQLVPRICNKFMKNMENGWNVLKIEKQQ